MQPDPAAFPDPRAADRELADLRGAGLDARALDAAATACAASADPMLALSSLCRLVGAYRTKAGRAPKLTAQLLTRLVPVLAASRVLGRELANRPRLLGQLAATRHFTSPRPGASLTRALQRQLARVPTRDDDGVARVVRRFKYSELLRIASRELTCTATLPESATELGTLAETCLDAVLRRAAEELAVIHGVPEGGLGRPALGCCALGMGKLGSGELNFSSDIDLILVYADEGETAGGPGGKRTNREFYGLLAEKVIQLLSRVTPDGFVYRVDLDLRPDGRSGPIAIGCDAAFRYYEAKGRTWERAALLRARPVAGDRALGSELLASLEPFVYRRYLDLEAVEEIRAMKARIDREASRGPDDLKLGRGGIREAEFVVAALLLLHAGRDKRLRTLGTLPALDKLLFAGLLSARDRDALADAYVLLRRAEHHVQMLEERQTHALPTQNEDRERLARSLGYVGADPSAQLIDELDRRRADVEAIFSDLLGVSGARPRPEDPLLQLALDATQDDAARARALSASGLADPVSALAELERLARRSGSPFAEHPVLGLEDEAERLLAEVIRTPDPDQALRHLAAFASVLRDPAPYFRFLARNPATSRLLLELFGTSDYLSKYFLRHPELIDPLMRRGTAVARKGRERLAEEAASRLAAHRGLEDKLAALRRFKNEEVLRIGLNDISGALDLPQVAEELTWLARACLGEALALAREEVTERYGRAGGGATLSVVGLGKLGGHELGYHSDLDLVFLYSSSEGESEGGPRGVITNGEWFARLAQRLLSHLQVPLREGFLYRTDTRLRPSGSQGSLVVSVAALASYHLREAAFWERQALLKAQHVAGDAALFAQVQREILEPALFRTSVDPVALAASIASMRARMEAELSGESSGRRNPKTGYGGLVDVEFAVQFLQLAHGATHPSLRVPGTPEAIERLREAELLSEADAALFSAAYRFLRRLELRLRIVHDHGLAHLPQRGLALTTLARRMGYEGNDAGPALLSAYAKMTEEVRATFRRILAAS